MGTAYKLPIEAPRDRGTTAGIPVPERETGSNFAEYPCQLSVGCNRRSSVSDRRKDEAIRNPPRLRSPFPLFLMSSESSKSLNRRNKFWAFSYSEAQTHIFTAPMNTILSPSLSPPPPPRRMKKAAILYHYPCPDGAFAALAAHLYFSATSTPTIFFPNTVYSPVTTQSLPLHEIDRLYLLDFVGPPGFVRDVSAKVPWVVVLDHHKTALETLGVDGSKSGGNVSKVIDMERSGATIAYDYFKSRVEDDDRVREFERVRRLFEYVEDGDLWRWRLDHSKAFSSGLKDLNLEFDVRLNSSLFNQLLSLDIEAVISQGMSSLSHKQKLMDDALNQSYTIALGAGTFGHCLAVDADALSELRSELGNQLADKSDKMSLRGIGAVVYKVPELGNVELLKVSLRSLAGEDTTPISQNFGGGGHRNASSFMLSAKEFERWKVQAIPQ